MTKEDDAMKTTVMSKNYVPPHVLKMGDANKGAGDCEGNGSGATGTDCQEHGYGASLACDAFGSNAGAGCTDYGGSAAGGCDCMGETPR